MTFFLNNISKVVRSSLFKSSLVYTVINFINKVFPFILLPVFTRAFSLEEYGSFSIYRVVVSFGIPLVGLSLSEAVLRYYYDKDELNFGEYLYSIIAVNTLSLLIIICLVFFFGDYFIAFMRLPKSFLYLSVVVSFFTCINNIERGLLRCENNNKYFAVIVIGQSLLLFILMLVLLHFSMLTLNNVIMTEVFVFFIFALISFQHLYKKYDINFNFNKTYFFNALKFSIPLMLNSILAISFALSDRFIINYHLDSSSVAIYSASFQLSSILSILAVSFNGAWIPWVYSNLKKNAPVTSILRVQALISVGYLIVGFAFWYILHEFLPIIVGAKYSKGQDLLLWFVGASILQALYWLFSPILQYYKKTWMFLFGTIPAVIFSISFNLLFLDEFGLIFAAKINFFTWFILFLVTFINSIRTIQEHRI